MVSILSFFLYQLHLIWISMFVFSSRIQVSVRISSVRWKCNFFLTCICFRFDFWDMLRMTFIAFAFFMTRTYIFLSIFFNYLHEKLDQDEVAVYHTIIFSSNHSNHVFMIFMSTTCLNDIADGNMIWTSCQNYYLSLR